MKNKKTTKPLSLGKSLPSKKSKPSSKGKNTHVVTVNSKEKLLRAGLEIFSRLGFYGATTKEIAKCAGVNEALTLRHFKSKKGLFLAIFEKEANPSVESFIFPLKKNLEENLIAFIERRLQSDHCNANYIKLILFHSLMDDELSKDIKHIVVKRKRAALASFLKTLREKKILTSTFEDGEIAEVIEQLMFANFVISHLSLEYNLENTKKHIYQGLKILLKGLN